MKRLADLFSGGKNIVVRGNTGNVVIGNVTGILIQTTTLESPVEPLSLPWREISVGENLSFFNLLTWRSRLAPALVGRDEDRSGLLAWALDDQRPIAIRVLAGPGGAGKSRLAAEVSDLLRQRSWNTGFVAVDKTTDVN